jgi:pyridoxamine 5'-phosphate oxidase
MNIKIRNLRKEYLFQPLREEDIALDPLLLFRNWFEEAEMAEVDEPNAMVLSTADHKGNVSARVVLLKDVDLGGFVFFSNYTSRKGKHLEVNAKAALTFHWKEIGRQVRIEGRVKKVPRRYSTDYFNSRPIDSRISAVASPQSCVIPNRQFLEALREGVLLDLGKGDPECPDVWGGYLLKPVLLEFWQGREHRLHDRIQYRLRGKDWIAERLAP